jgi:hypothetical protein
LSRPGHAGGGNPGQDKLQRHERRAKLRHRNQEGIPTWPRTKDE